jgi:hypothetical protein
MTGAEVPKDLWNSDAQGAQTTFITAAVGSYSYSWMMGTKKGMFCVQVVTVELT